MYPFFSAIDKISRRINNYSKIAYYKAKFGKRLKIGKGVCFRKGFIINISENGFLEIGNNSFFNNNCSINCRDKIIIGSDNLFGENVKIYDHNHVFNDKKLNIKRSFTNKQIIIGDRNWFGSNVVILSGAKIGSYNVFGASTIINNEYGSECLVRVNDKISVEKIQFRESKNE